MSFVIAVPETVTAAASTLAELGTTIGSASAVAAAPTTGVLAAAHDEVSTAIAAMFSGYGSQFQALSTQAAAFHAQFVQALHGGAAAYAGAEAANANPLQTLEQDALGAVNAPFYQFTGRPLIGNGANGTTVNGVGTNGGAGGWLYGSGGNGGTSITTGATGGAGGAAGLIGNGGTGGNTGLTAPDGTFTSAPFGIGGNGGNGVNGGTGGTGGTGGYLVGQNGKNGSS
jgi:hypothetical protein